MAREWIAENYRDENDEREDDVPECGPGAKSGEGQDEWGPCDQENAGPEDGEQSRAHPQGREPCRAKRLDESRRKRRERGNYADGYDEFKDDVDREVKARS